MAQTLDLWAHVLAAGDRDDTTTTGEAVVADSQRREREKNECGQCALPAAAGATTQLPLLLAHA